MATMSSRTANSFSGAQVAFDVFRFEKGKIAERWDNIQDKYSANESGG